MTTYRLPTDGSWLAKEPCPFTVPDLDTGASKPCPGRSNGTTNSTSEETLTVCTWSGGHQWSLDMGKMLTKYATPVDTDTDKVTRVQAVLDDPHLAWTAPQRQALEHALTGACE